MKHQLIDRFRVTGDTVTFFRILLFQTLGLFTFCLLGLSTSAFSQAIAIAETPKQPMIAFLGDSNLLGSGQFQELSTTQQSPFQSVQIFNPIAAQYAPLQASVSSGNGYGPRIGPEIGFSEGYQSHFNRFLAWNQLALLKIGTDGSTVSPQNGSPALAWQPGGLYDLFYSVTQLALQQSRNQTELKAIVFNIGFNDATLQLTAEFSRSLRQLIQAIEHDFPNVPLFFCGMSNHYPRGGLTNADIQTVNQSLQQAASQNENIYFIDFNDIPIKVHDPAHYSTQGQIQAGRLIFEALKAHFRW